MLSSRRHEPVKEVDTFYFQLHRSAAEASVRFSTLHDQSARRALSVTWHFAQQEATRGDLRVYRTEGALVASNREMIQTLW